MNAYGQRAMNHWRTYLPTRYAQIPDPQTFFTDLGEQVQELVTELSATLEAQQDLSRDYLTRVGQLRMCRTRAEEAVLTEMVLLPAEDPQETPASSSSTWEVGLLPDDPRIDQDGMPTDRSHPLWQDLSDDSLNPQEFQTRAEAWRAQIRASTTSR